VVTEVEGKNMAQWKQELVHPDPSQREHAIRAVIQFGDAGSEAVPLLVSRAQDLDASPRVRAIMALRMVPVQEKDIPKVVAILARRVDPYTEAQAIVRYEAAKSLAHLGENARGAIDALRRGAKDSACWETRQMCLMVLRQVGRDPKLGADPRAVQSFLDAIRDPTAKVRLEALLGLATMGRPSDPKLLTAVQSALQGQLNNRDKSMVIWAHIGLLGLEDKVPESTLKGLSNLLKNRSLEVRIQAALALGAIAPERAHWCPICSKCSTTRNPVPSWPPVPPWER